MFKVETVASDKLAEYLNQADVDDYEFVSITPYYQAKVIEGQSIISQRETFVVEAYKVIVKSQT